MKNLDDKSHDTVPLREENSAIRQMRYELNGESPRLRKSKWRRLEKNIKRYVHQILY
jgi:hypothetical protein